MSEAERLSWNNSDFFKEFVAVERVGKYCKLKPEVNSEGSINAPFGWPCQGVISFDSVYLKYRYIKQVNQ